jgi:hypothetical protein
VSSTVGTIAATKWDLSVIGDQQLVIPGSWPTYAKNSAVLPAPQARLYNQAQLGTNGYFTVDLQWSGVNIVMTEFPLPYSTTVSANNVYDVQISLDGGYTWVPASSAGHQITVVFTGYSSSCVTYNCQSCAAVSTCTWYSKGDGKGWCSQTVKTIAGSQTGSAVQPSTACSAIGVADAFTPIPVAASVTTIDAVTSLLTVTLQFTFYQSSESPSSVGTTIEYDISALSTELDNNLTISGPASYSYFKNYAISTVVQLQFSGTVKQTDLSNDFTVNIDYYDANGYFYSDTGVFNLRGGATISTKDIQATETLFLLSGVSYPAPSLPTVSISFPSYQFASSAYLTLDGANVLKLTNASSTYTIDHVASQLSVGVHILATVVNNQVSSKFAFYVVPAPAWVSAMRTYATASVSSAVKGLSVQSAFPVQDIFPAITFDINGVNTVVDPSISGNLSFAYPLNGLVSAAVQEVASFPPTVMDDPTQGVFAVATNLQTVVGGATPSVQLNSVKSNTSFYSTLGLASFTQSLSYLGSVCLKKRERGER